MHIRFVLTIISCTLLLYAGMAEKYQLDAGNYTVKFDSTQELVVQPPLPHEEHGSHAGGWNIFIHDNMSHAIEEIASIEENKIVPLSSLDEVLENNMAGASGLKPKSSIKLNGINGRMIEGFRPQIGFNSKVAIVPFNQFYDPFYKQNAAKVFILLAGYDLPVYDEILNSLNITMNPKI